MVRSSQWDYWWGLPLIIKYSQIYADIPLPHCWLALMNIVVGRIYCQAQMRMIAKQTAEDFAVLSWPFIHNLFDINTDEKHIQSTQGERGGR